MTSVETQTKPIGWIVGAATAAATIFVLDVVIPLGISVPILFVLPILLTRRISGWRSTVIVTGGVVLLTWVRLIPYLEKVAPVNVENRALTSFLLLIVAGLLLKEKLLVQQRAMDLMALRESETRFRFIADAAPVLIWIAGPDKRCTYFNQGWLDFTGRSLEQEIGDGWTEGVHPDDYERCLKAYVAAFDHRKRFTMEYHLRRADGRYGWIVDQGVPLWGDDGQFRGYIGACVDITDREEIEAKLRESEERFRTMAQAVPSFLFETDAAGWNVWTSEGWCKFTGQTPEQVAGHGWAEALHPDDAAANIDHWTQCIKDGVPFEAQQRLRRSDGVYVWVIARALPVRDSQGKVTRWVGSVTNVDDIVRVQDALRESEERFAKAFRTSPNPIGITEVATGRCIEVNEACLQLFGFCREEVIGNTTLMLGIWPNQEDRTRFIERLKAGQPVRNLELSFKTQSGELRHILVSSDLVELGGTLCLITIGNDITERKQAQIAVTAAKEQLQATLTASDIGTWRWDLTKNTLVTDANLKQLFHIETGEEVSLERYVERITSDDRDRIGKAIESAIRKGGAYDEQFRVAASDGTERWIHARGKVERDEGGTARSFPGVAIDITARKLAEQALRESEERLRLFIEHAPSALAMCDRNMRYLAVSRRWMDDYGLRDRPLIGRSHYDVFPEIPDRWKDVHQRGLAGEVVREEEDRFERADGSVLWLRWEVHPWRLSDGQVGGIVMFTENITERKQAEEALREAESNYRTIFQEAGVGVAKVDSRTGQFLKVNRKYCEMVGRTEDEMLATTFMSLTHSDDLAEDLGHMERMRRGELSTYTMEKRYLKKDGSVVWVILNVAPLWQPGDMPSQHIAIVQDITARKQMETALRESEERLMLALESANMGTWDWDTETDLLLWNDRQFELFGIRAEDFHGTGAEALSRIHGEDRLRVAGAVQRAMEEGVTFKEEFQVVHADGSVHWLFGSGRPVRGAHNRYGHMVGVNFDITERRRTEEKIQALNETLEARVRERTAALAEANERWGWVVRATNDGIWDWDLVRDTAYFSPRWKEMHGFQEGDALESTNEWRIRIHPEDRQSVLASLEAYLRGEKAEFWEEYRIQRKDGAYIWVLDRGIAIFNEQGQAVRMVGAETDITWRKGVEQTLRFKEQQYHTLADNVPALFGYIDQDRRYQFVNRRYEELFGRSAEELRGMAVQDLLGPDGYAQVEPFLIQALAGNAVSFEYTLKLPGDDTRYFTVQYMPDRNEQEQVLGVFVLMADVTTLKSTEALLREREAQLRELGARLLRAQEDERRRISRDLHDDVMQRMGALALELYGLASSMSSQDRELQSQLKSFGASAEQLTTDLQRMAHQLHPSVLEFGGLEAAMREQVDDFGVRTGLSAELIVKDVSKDIPLDQATCLYRVLQEGLQNVQKHANATSVLVRLLRTGRGLGLCIHDDGRGTGSSERAARRKGLGLTSMAERVGMLDGVFRIRAKPGNGTELHAWVPLELEKNGRGE